MFYRLYIIHDRRRYEIELSDTLGRHLHTCLVGIYYAVSYYANGVKMSHVYSYPQYFLLYDTYVQRVADRWCFCCNLYFNIKIYFFVMPFRHLCGSSNLVEVLKSRFQLRAS
jgi:hypothetical protein